MADNNSSSTDVLQKGIQLANQIKGAIKTGKSIAAAARGGAAGGWIGAAIAFAWENRRLLASITVGLVVILLLPTVIIAMLPSLIFDGIKDAFSPDDPSTPIINNPTVIEENIKSIETTVKTAFNDSLDSIIEEIEEDIKSLPANAKTEIIKPSEDDVNYDVSLIISQYCAYKEEDYKDICIEDFEKILKDNKDDIYYYEKTEETKQIEEKITIVDADTGEETESINYTEEKFTVYTVIYKGEEYFANDVFKLTDKQKELANDYAENLSVYLSGGI